jgi:hypothetical protein
MNELELKDIRDVAVDQSLSKDERIAEFVRQIGDPYHFRYGEYTVTARFPQDAPTLEDRLKGIML